MLDQSFSAKNFNYIFINENNKGNFVKSFLPQEYFDKHQEFRNVILKKNELKKQGALTKDMLDDISTSLDNINKEKEEIRLAKFENYAEEVSSKQFNFDINYKPAQGIFTLGEHPATYFAIKQLQSNIYNTFKVIQSDRNLIVKQLFGILRDGFPKVIVRTDIRAFYENIPQAQLFRKIEDNTLLSPYSKKLLKKMFFIFEDKKDSTKIPEGRGIPRGIAISPYLAELFMKDIDAELKSVPELIYYARYVDDIVAIFSPKTISTTKNYVQEIKDIIENNGMSLNDGLGGSTNKTKVIQLHIDRHDNTGKKIKDSLTYLGYKFNIEHTIKSGDSKLILELSDEKINRINTRIVQTIKEYCDSAKYNEKKARKLLIARLKFLTGNYHLNNIKRNIKSGVYYSNALLLLNDDPSKIKSLKALQRKFSSELNKIKTSVSPINKENLINYLITKFSFEKGFFERKKSFHSFNKFRYYKGRKNDGDLYGLNLIVKIWK